MIILSSQEVLFYYAEILEDIAEHWQTTFIINRPSLVPRKFIFAVANVSAVMVALHFLYLLFDCNFVLRPHQVSVGTATMLKTSNSEAQHLNMSPHTLYYRCTHHRR